MNRTAGMLRFSIQMFAVLALTAAFLMLTACGRNSTEMKITTRNGVTTYNGTERQLFTVTAGEPRELHISVSRQGGRISISVLRTENQKYAYRGTDISTSDFIVSLPEPGKYQVTIDVKDFQGSYEILPDGGTMQKRCKLLKIQLTAYGAPSEAQ